MIAFSRELLEEDERPAPMLIVGPIVEIPKIEHVAASLRDAEFESRRDSATCRLQAELAMLQRALIRCGLFENATGSIKG